MKFYPSIHDRLNNQHLVIGELIKDLRVEQLVIHPHPDKWNIHENIAHLAKYQQVFMDRINKIVNNNGISFPPYKAEDDPEFELWVSWNTNELFQTILTDRLKIIELLNNIKEPEINHTAFHLKYGRLNITEWTEFFLLHEAHHLFTIFQIVHNK